MPFGIDTLAVNEESFISLKTIKGDINFSIVKPSWEFDESLWTFLLTVFSLSNFCLSNLSYCLFSHCPTSTFLLMCVVLMTAVCVRSTGLPSFSWTLWIHSRGDQQLLSPKAAMQLRQHWPFPVLLEVTIVPCATAWNLAVLLAESAEETQILVP